MACETMNTQLWKPRRVSETLAIDADWAKDDDAAVLAAGCATPTWATTALRAAGCSTFEGTDILAEMLALAEDQTICRRVWRSKSGTFDVKTVPYNAILACGAISLRAAPPATLDLLIGVPGPGGHPVLSDNDPTLADTALTGHPDVLNASAGVTQVFRDDSPHLPEKGLGSDLIILRQR